MRPHLLTAQYWFGEIDSRPLAAFRIVFALLLIKDALYRFLLADWFYSDHGIVPRSALFDGLVRTSRFSLMDAVGQTWLAEMFLLAWIIILLALLVGYRTRLMAVLNFIFILSVHERNGFILTGADTAMRVFSFWMMFAPIAQHYSIDAIRRRISGYGSDVPPAFALPARTLQLQLVIIYISTAYLKALEPVWRDGQALYYVLRLDSILLPPGAWLRQAPDWLHTGLTHYTLIAEFIIPLLLLFPLRRWFVGLAFMLALLLHGGIGITLAIPDFSIVMWIAFTAHFPPEWFDLLEAWLKAPVQYLWRLAFIRRVQNILLSRTPPPSESSYWHKIILPVVLIPLLGLVIWWNVVESTAYAKNYGQTSAAPMPPALENIIWYSGLWQWWDLFAPLPIQYDGYLVIPGHFENGFEFDLRTHHPQPDHELFPRFGPLMRFEKLEENLARYEDAPILRAWGNYYCRYYNEERAAVRGTRLATLEIEFVFRDTAPPGEPPNPYQVDILWEHWCFDEYAPAD